MSLYRFLISHFLITNNTHFNTRKEDFKSFSVTESLRCRTLKIGLSHKRKNLIRLRVFIGTVGQRTMNYERTGEKRVIYRFIIFILTLYAPCIILQHVYEPTSCTKILAIALYFPLDTLHVSDYISPSSGATL
jgi:hypothetical protein